MQQQSIAVFRNHYLSTDTNMASVVTSEAIPVSGNEVNMAATVINTSSSIAADELIFQLEGSIDGDAWRDLGATAKITMNAFGYKQLSSPVGTFSYPFVRVKASLLTATESALFDVTIAFSDQ